MNHVIDVKCKTKLHSCNNESSDGKECHGYIFIVNKVPEVNIIIPTGVGMSADIKVDMWQQSAKVKVVGKQEHLVVQPTGKARFMFMWIWDI
jgi:hypothetical protein